VRGRVFPWFLAAIPATLVGHGIAYVLTGQSDADGRHSYLLPALECSLALLFTFCAARLLRALSLPRGPAATASSLLATAAKLAVAQVALFALAERLEGHAPTAIGFAIQVVVALLAAVAIAYFARLVRRFERSAIDAGEYLRRFRLNAAVLRLDRARHSPAYALAVSAGTARFQRPPPLL